MMSVPLHYQRLCEKVAALAPGSRVIIYGAGQVGQELYEVFRAQNVPVVGFVDQNARSFKSTTDVTFFLPSELEALEVDVVVIASIAFFQEIKSDLLQLGLAFDIHGLLDSEELEVLLGKSPNPEQKLELLYRYPEQALIWRELMALDKRHAHIFQECINRLSQT